MKLIARTNLFDYKIEGKQISVLCFRQNSFIYCCTRITILANEIYFRAPYARLKRFLSTEKIEFSFRKSTFCEK